MDITAVVASIRGKLSDYISEHSLDSLVLGVSGGVDSAVCAALARPVCDYHGIDLIGRSIPICSNKTDEVTRAATVGRAFCTDFKEIDLGGEFEALAGILIEDDEQGMTYESKIRRGNLKARLRMIRLYDLAKKHNGIVLSTDNLTEFLLGFWTICGDVGDYGMIQKLWKSEVYEIGRSLVLIFRLNKETAKGDSLEACIEAVPTDGLGISNSDLDQIGASSYDEIERILKTWLCVDEDCFAWDGWLRYEGRPETYEELKQQRQKISNHPVVKKCVDTSYKRLGPAIISRYDIQGLSDDE